MTAAAATELASSHIRIGAFRQILIWPLALELAADDAGGDIRAAVDRVAAAFDADTKNWRAELDLLDHAGVLRRDTHRRDADGKLVPLTPADPDLLRAQAEADGQTYGEFVYFYDFLQRTIYDDAHDRPPRQRPIRLWRHTRLRSVEFDLHLDAGPTASGVKTYRADVERLLVYLFDSGAAVVALEVDFDRALNSVRDPAADGGTRDLRLADVLTIADRLRRAYTPYFEKIDRPPEDGSVEMAPRGVVSRVVWHFEDAAGERTRGTAAPATFRDDVAFVRKMRTIGRKGSRSVRRREAPVAAHWRDLLSPLVFAGYAGSGPVWRHVLDERIPLMSFVSLSGAAAAAGIEVPADPAGQNWAAAQRADYGLIGRGDWLRLCGADSAGIDPMPYNPAFLEEMEREAFYDRFAADPQTTSAVRFLFAGYHFATVGAGWFFDHVAVHHFRRHYFQMMLLANLELASLLVTSSRITDAVTRLRRDDGDGSSANKAHRRFMDDLQSISEWFLTFVHRYRFSGVSNQIQPTEIYDRMRKSMRLEGLYEEVKGELEAAVAFNATCEQRRMTASGERLSNIATLGAAIGLALTFLDMGPVAGTIREFYKARLESQASQQTASQTPAAPNLALLFEDLRFAAFGVSAFATLMLLFFLFYLWSGRSGQKLKFRRLFTDATAWILLFVAVLGGWIGIPWLGALLR